MKNVFMKVGLWVTLLCTTSIWAAPITNFSVTPADLTTGVATTYTIQFDAAGAITTSPNRSIRFITGAGPGGANMDNASVLSTSPNITLSCTNCSVTSAFMWITASSVSPGETVTIVLQNVINPVQEAGNSLTINVEDSGYSAVDTATIPGITFGGNPGPVVVNTIPNQNIQAQDGAQAANLGGGNTDLNYTFEDGDGDPLTFSVLPGYDTNVVTAQVINDELILTGQNTGSTSITVEADDNDEGTVTDTFNVSVIGSIGPASVTPASTTAGETTSYSFTFRAATTLNDGDFVIFNTQTGDQNQENSTLTSISGGGLTGTLSNNTATRSVVWFNGGNAPAGTTITVVLDNIVNPGASGQAGDYVIQTTDGGSTTGIIDVAGTVFGSTSVPTVVNLIPDQTLAEEDGATVVDLDSGPGINTDLNFTFTDGDGHPLTFSIDPGHDTNVVTAAVVADELVLTGQGTGSTTVTVRAADGIDGSVTTDFNVSVVGDLVPATVLPSSLFAGETETYTIVFSPATDLDSGDFIIFTTQAGGPDQTNSTLNQLSGGSLTGSITAGNQTTTVIMFDGGSASPSDAITVVLGNIINPGVGQGPDYTVATTDGGNVTGISTVAGDQFIASDLIFENGFGPLPPIIVEINELLKGLATKASSESTELPVLNLNFNQVHYHGLTLSLSDFGHDKDLLDLMVWLEAVLIESTPNGDFDGDGLINQLDEYPFNY